MSGKSERSTAAVSSNQDRRDALHTRSAPDAAHTWQPLLAWLMSTEARAVAKRHLRRCALLTGDDLVDDVLGEVMVAVLAQRDRNPTVVENPAAYGSTVIRNHVSRLVRRRHEPWDDTNEAVHQDALVLDGVMDGVADEIRLLIATEAAPAWLTAASLTYLTLVMYPAAVPEHTPSPMSGSRPDQARAWPSLWLAGQRELFVDPCPPAVRRRRGRRITHLLAHMGDVFARFRLQQWKDDRNGG